jgi:phosphomannomutase
MTAASIRFGTDGWRGLIADDFTFPNVRRTAAATAAYIRRHGASVSTQVLVGYDRRFFSEAFAREAAHIFAQQGLLVKLVDSPMTTPSLSVCVVDSGSEWGIMITASHNPALYNGFKIKDRHGRSAPPEVTQEIETSIPAEAPAALDMNLERFAFRKTYDDYLRRRLDWTALRRLKATAVFDHLHGVAAGIPEALLAKTKIKCVSLHAAHDPLFGGLHPEPIEAYLGDLKTTVRRQRAIVGIALDGDADRLGIVDDKGRYLTPHQVFPLLALHCIEFKKWRGKIVQSVSLGALGERIAKAYGLPFEEVPVGFKHVAERMLKEDILAGGEESGGYAVRGGLPERDGILSGLMFLEMIAARGRKPSELLAEMEKRFGKARFHRVDIALEKPLYDKAPFVTAISSTLPGKLIGQSIADVRTADGLKIVLSSGAWVLLRPSGTEPLVRTYAETDSVKKTNKLLIWAQERVRGYLKESKRS